MATETRDVYMNRVQQRIFYAGARDLRVVAARRFGKTDGVLGPRIWAVAQSLPQGAGGFLGTSRKQLFGRTVPGVIAALERFYGFKEGVHFGWGKPPKGTPPCIIRPKSYENSMWFANGHLMHTLSLATIGSANGMTLCYVDADECKFLPKKKIDEEVMPANSGIVHPLGDKRFTEENPYYKSTCFVSDASLSSRSNWLAKEESVLDQKIEGGEFDGKPYREIQTELDRYADRVMYFNELLRSAKRSGHRVQVVSAETRERIRAVAAAIEAREGQFRIIPRQYQVDNKHTIEMLLSYKLIADDDAELLYDYKYLMTQDEQFEMMAIRGSKKYQKHIDALRRNCFYFVRASSLDNIDILGEDYIRRMKRDLPPLVFLVSVLNLKPGRTGEGFYYNYDPDIHCYTDDDCPAIDKSYIIKEGKQIVGGTAYKTEYETPDFGYLADVDDCTLDGDCRDDEPLQIAFDAGKIVNWIVTGQMYPRDGHETLNVISSMFVKDGEMLQHLIRKWDHYYAPHKRKNADVIFYYDHTFLFKPTGVYINDIKDTIIGELRKYGWNVIAVPIGQTWAHHVRYKDENEGLAGLSYPQVRFNAQNNEALCIAIENCGTKLAYGRENSRVTKDKAGEKLATDSERKTAGATPEELRTDGTDAFDTLYIGVRHYRNGGSSFLMTPDGR